MKREIITEVSFGPDDDPDVPLARLHDMYRAAYGDTVVNEALEMALRTGVSFHNTLRFIRNRNDALIAIRAFGVSMREAGDSAIKAAAHLAAMKTADADAHASAEHTAPRNRRERRAAKHTKPKETHQQWNRHHRGLHSRNRR